MTSESVSNEGINASSGIPSVLMSDPSAWWTREYSACPLLVNPWCRQAEVMPATQCAQVLSQCTNGTITKSPGRKSRTPEPTSSMTPTHS